MEAEITKKARILSSKSSLLSHVLQSAGRRRRHSSLSVQPVPLHIRCHGCPLLLLCIPLRSLIHLPALLPSVSRRMGRPQSNRHHCARRQERALRHYNRRNHRSRAVHGRCSFGRQSAERENQQESSAVHRRRSALRPCTTACAPIWSCFALFVLPPLFLMVGGRCFYSVWCSRFVVWTRVVSGSAFLPRSFFPPNKPARISETKHQNHVFTAPRRRRPETARSNPAQISRSAPALHGSVDSGAHARLCLQGALCLPMSW